MVIVKALENVRKTVTHGYEIADRLQTKNNVKYDVSYNSYVDGSSSNELKVI